MSKLTIAAAMLVIAASPIVAQDAPRVPSERVLELRSEMDRLRPLIEEARGVRETRVAEREEVKRVVAANTAAVDTVQIGLMTVLTPEGNAESARSVIEEVWADHFSHVDRSPSIESAWFEVQWGAPRVPIYVPPTEHRVAMGYWPSVSEEDVPGYITWGLADVLHGDLLKRYDVGTDRPQRPNVGRWATENVHYYQDWERLFRIVAMTQSIVSRDCLSGDIAACKSALGLDLPRIEGRRGTWVQINAETIRLDPPTDRARLESWYEPIERRALVANNTDLAQYRSESYRRCVRDEDVSTCDELLLELELPWIPLAGSVRTSLLALALERGGTGSWGRVLADPTMTPEEALEHISGDDLDDLVSAWRDRLLAAQRPAHGSLVPRGALALLWITFFAALAVRSTRWRLG